MGQRNSKSSDGADSAPSNVVSASMPAPKASSTIGNKVALGAGCYWGTEKFVRKGESKILSRTCCHACRNHVPSSVSCVDFQKRFPGSIKTAKVGFMSPDSSPRIKNPTYQQVCTGRSGHGKLGFYRCACADSLMIVVTCLKHLTPSYLQWKSCSWN